MTNMVKNRNITSPIRSGFDYQDLWTLKLCGDWLSNPDKYKWIQIEANPTEDKFFLDDIVLLDNIDKYHLYQAKFKTDHTYTWVWDDFLKTRTGKKGKSLPSLLKKWATSFHSLKTENIEEVLLITNGTISEEIQKFILNQKVDIEKLKKENSNLYYTIQTEVGDESDTTEFFSKFKFVFENKRIDDIETEIVEDIFCNSLSATINGVNSLLLAIKKEARNEFTVKLSIELIKQWCEFDKPKPLNEKFEIPSDFQFFDENTHNTILQNFQNTEGGVKIIFGKPGTGKSVYLSQLSEILKKQNILTIKHHYHINPAENNSFERLTSERVIEAVKAQFKSTEFKQYLGELANKNSKEIPLRDFISQVAQNLLQDQKSLVIIIDGLDHVTREKDVNELKKFLDEIFYPQTGVWIVFGTQPQVKNEPILHSIFSKCSTDNEIEIKGLNKNTISEIINENLIKLNIPEDNIILRDLINKIFDITKGNPLHLRYILKQLKNTFHNTLVTEYSCSNLIPYSDDIQEYYSTLWNTLGNNIKTFLLTFIGVDFQFTYQQFIECISSFDDSDLEISNKFKKVQHLISSDSRNRFGIFHNSFEVFLLDQNEWTEQKQIIKINIKKWLEKSNYENLKWAELRKLEYSLGNNNQILEIDKNWLIDAISHPRNSSQIKSQLNLCLKVAIEKKYFVKALEVSNLNTYYKNAHEFIEEASQLIWIESINLNPYFIDDLILSELPSDILVSISNIANEFGKFYVIDDIIEILQERLYYQEYRVGVIPTETRAIIKVIPYDRNYEANRIYNYIIQFREFKISSLLFSFYSKQLLLLDQKTKLNELLNFDLENQERQVILENCIKHDLKQKTSEFKVLIENNEHNSLLGQIYLILQGETLSQLPKLPNYNEFPHTIKEHGEERGMWTEKFHDLFLIGFIYALSDEQKYLEQWIKAAPVQWPAQATSTLFASALKIASKIENDNKIDYKDIFSDLKDIEDLHWPDDGDKLEFKHAFTNALTNILKGIVYLKYSLDDSVIINKTDYKTIISTPFFKQYDLFNLILELNIPILEKSVFQIISNTKIKALAESINYFSERSEDYVNLANFNLLYKENSKSRELLNNAIDNFLGYGYHNDAYIFDVLESIELCTKANIDQKIINDWIQRIIPIISNIGEYTDGAETHPLVDFLSKYRKKLLFKFYFSLAEKEELYPAQETFKYVIKSLSFSEDVEIALASTALDKDSLHELKEKAKISEKAKASLEIIQTYFGEIHYKDDYRGSSYDFQEEETNYSEVTADKLEEHLKKIESKWDFDKYIIGWTKFWLEENDKQVIYHLIKSISFKNNDIKYVSGELLDILYPLAYEFDNEESFKYLCFAQINDHGWDRSWTYKSNVEKRWTYLKEKYPRRYLEFFENSVGGGFPLSRGIEFFIYFDDIAKAEKITEAGLVFSEELMADLNLESPDWAKDTFQEIDEIDLLFQRLVWPSPLVRERAATAIGNLMATSPQKEEIYSRLLAWIRSWKIESIIAIGLLPIIKTFQVCVNTKDVSFIKIEDIINSIQASSIVIEELLEEIIQKTKEQYNKLPEYIPAENIPYSYKPNEFFRKYLKTILAPIYSHRAIEIETKTYCPFTKIWAYNAEMIAQNEGVYLNPNHDFYGQNKNGKFLTGFSTKVSEIYRSAFLRVLHAFYIIELIPFDFYLEYSLATLPIDLPFWKITPNTMPELWPKLTSNGIKTEKENDFSIIQFKEPIENIVKSKKEGNIILGAEGAICPASGWQECPTHSFSIIGFGYKVLGANLPNPEDVADEISQIPQTTMVDKPLNFLNNSVYFDIDSKPLQVKDLVIFPLVTRNKDLIIGLWQYFKDMNRSFHVVDDLRSDLKIVIKNNKWIYEDKDNNEIIIFEDWLEGLQERYEFEMPIPQGHQVLINEVFLTEKLKKNNLRLGFILKTTFTAKKHSYDDIKIVTNFKFINVSNVIS